MKKVGAIIASGAIFLAVGCAKPVDETHEGTLEEGDETIDSDGSFFDGYTVRMKEGWRIQATMTSDEFDTTLLFFAPEGGQPLQQNDDCHHPSVEMPNETDSCVDYTVTRSGTFQLAANGFDADEFGDYTLTIVTSEGGDSAAEESDEESDE